VESRLVILAVLLAYGRQLVDRQSMLHNGLAVGLVARDYTQPNVLPGIATARLVRGIREGTLQVVDARIPEAYAAGHIPSAISFPVDAVLGEIDTAVAKLQFGRLTVVYCQSDEWIWSDRVGAWLQQAGCSDVHDYRPGYRGWIEANHVIEVADHKVK
jgi:rhodanese-related sulfurtransferase